MYVRLMQALYGISPVRCYPISPALIANRQREAHPSIFQQVKVVRKIRWSYRKEKRARYCENRIVIVGRKWYNSKAGTSSLWWIVYAYKGMYTYKLN